MNAVKQTNFVGFVTTLNLILEVKLHIIASRIGNLLVYIVHFSPDKVNARRKCEIGGHCL